MFYRGQGNGESVCRGSPRANPGSNREANGFVGAGPRARPCKVWDIFWGSLRAESACGILPGLELRRWLNWIEHLTTDQEVTGSSPVRRAIYHSPERVYESEVQQDFRLKFYWSATGPFEK